MEYIVSICLYPPKTKQEIYLLIYAEKITSKTALQNLNLNRLSNLHKNAAQNYIN